MFLFSPARGSYVILTGGRKVWPNQYIYLIRDVLNWEETVKVSVMNFNLNIVIATLKRCTLERSVANNFSTVYP